MPTRQTKFHGRTETDQTCSHPGCDGAGEFRAPAGRRANFDGPGDWRWLCLDHVRAFNSGYNFFEGMSTEEIEAAQTPYGGWDRETRAFSASASSPPPKWADFSDPLDAIGARFRGRVSEARQHQDQRFNNREREALRTLGLEASVDRKGLRQRYSDLVRKYHPDRNGGDRSQEGKLQAVVEAYQQLKGSRAFA